MALNAILDDMLFIWAKDIFIDIVNYFFNDDCISDHGSVLIGNGNRRSLLIWPGIGPFIDYSIDWVSICLSIFSDLVTFYVRFNSSSRNESNGIWVNIYKDLQIKNYVWLIAQRKL